MTNLRTQRIAKFIGAVICSLTVIANVFGQAASSPDRGVVSLAPYDSSGIENVNLQNGNLNLAIPLASLPPIAGSKLSFTLKAYYNSKLYDTYTEERRIIPPENNEGLEASRFYVEIPKLSEVGGWRLGGQYELMSQSVSNLFVPDMHLDPTPDLQLLQSYPWGRLYLVSPDGAKHEMRPLGYQPYWGGDPLFSGFYKDNPNNTNVAMKYYSVDGSYISMTVYPPSHSLYFEANFPDGTKVQTARTGTQRIIDPNGNSIKIFGDEQGLHFQDELTLREIRVKGNSAGNWEVWYKAPTGTDYKVEIVFGTTSVVGKFYSVDIPPIWGSQIPAPCTYQENWAMDVPVVREIIFPQTETGGPIPKYQFAYTSDQTLPDHAMYVAACNQTPPFATWPYESSKGLGELSQMTTPTGAVHKYSYQMDGTHVTGLGESAATNFLTQKKIEHDGVTDTWLYGSGDSGGGVTNPDGSFVNLFSYNHYFGSPSTSGGTLGLGGLVYKENRSNKIRIERRWVRRVFSGAYDIAGGGGLLVFNPVVTQEYTSLLDDSGNVSKMSASTFEYDFNGNVTKRTDYDWFPDPSIVTRDSFGIPLGVPANATVLRVTTNSYHNSPGTNAGSNDVYAKTSNLILNAVKESTTGNSITRLSYDSQNYGLPPVHGNVTTTASWDDATNQWLESLTGYDVYGNVTSRTDPSGNVTTIVYGDATHANPTSITVNPNNGTGAQTSSKTYDFETGLPTSSADVNGKISSISYTNHLLGAADPFGRPGTTVGPDVTVDGVIKRKTVKTYYEDAARRHRVESDLFNEGDQLSKARVTKDQLGRVILSEKNENGSSTYTISSQTIYKTDASVVMTSNPTRSTAASSDGWTRTTNDALGRVKEVATFSGATQPPVTGTNSSWTGSVVSTYAANSTIVTDQSGRARRSLVDPLGRLVRVDEPNLAGQLGDVSAPIQPTYYAYDVLGNLTSVQQTGINAEQCGGPTSCSQTRTFTYSTLSRLLTAANPESGTATYEYFPNGNLKKRTDARGVQTNYLYDGLNRQSSITYSDSTPAVTFTYDTLTNGKGRLTKVSSTVSDYTFKSYDELGRVKEAEQKLGAKTYTLLFAYDLDGRVTAITYPSTRVVNYGYDNSGHLNSFAGNLGSGGASRTYATGHIYDAADRLKKEQFGTDTAIYNKLWYNPRGQLSEIRESTSYTGESDVTWNRGKIINDYTLQCTGVGCIASDNNGNLRKQTVGVPINDQNSNPVSWYQQYEYDPVNRITQVNEFDDQAAPLWKQWFKYDRFGNRRIDVDNTSPEIPRPDFEVELGTNRLLAVGDPALPNNQRKMRYDDTGNLVNDSWTSFGSPAGAITRTYDAENRMISALDHDAGTTQYSYDGKGQRVRRTITNKPEVWQVYGLNGELLAEYPANGDPLSPQKEYGYRNSQLLITAEAGTAAAPAPTALASAPYNNGPSIQLNWTIASGATNYRIEKATSKNGPYSLAGTSATNSFIDNGVTSGTAYLYKVCAANAQNACTSSYSNFVLGVAFSFTTDPVLKSFAEDPANATTPKAAHITELRTAVNAVRTLAGRSPATWTNTNLQIGVSVISVDDVRDLRLRLNEALTDLGIPLPTYTDPALIGFIEDSQNATQIKAVHIRQLRDFVRSGVGGGGGGGGSSLQIRWMVSDQLGTPRMIFDQSGTLETTSRHDYLPFGEELTTQGLRSSQVSYANVDSTRQQFTGKERDDETGLDYFNARYFSNGQGRFTSADPFSIIMLRQSKSDKNEQAFSQFINDPRRWHRYAYTVNSPLVFTDNTGLDIMIIENHATSDNPFGHTAIAITGRGVWSFGNAEPGRAGERSTDFHDIVRGDVKDYIIRELPRRDTTIYIIKTTAAQDERAAVMLDAIATDGVILTRENILSDNCTIRVNKALDAAGVEKGPLPPSMPGSAGIRVAADPATIAIKTIDIPQNSNLTQSDLNAIKPFEVTVPRPNNPIPRPGTPGGTPVQTMRATTRRRP